MTTSRIKAELVDPQRISVQIAAWISATRIINHPIRDSKGNRLCVIQMVVSPTGTRFIPVIKTGVVELSNVVTPDDIIIAVGEIDNDRMLVPGSTGLIRADVSSWPARYQDAFALVKNKLTIDMLELTQSVFRTEPGDDRTICLVSDITVQILTLNEFGKGIGKSITAQIELWRHMEPAKHLYIVWTSTGHVMPLFIVPDKVDKG